MPGSKKDCRHYRGSRPCEWNKALGAECPDCGHYSPCEERILIVKLDAIGDVLRTTCILPKVKERYPTARVTWITRAESVELLRTNSYIDEVWDYDDTATLSRLLVQKWDVAYNLDNSHASSALASTAAAAQKVGFVLSERGLIIPTNETASDWLEMASFDRIKRENDRSYQEILYGMCGFDRPVDRPVLSIPDEVIPQADSGMDGNHSGPVIGINTGSGSRWPLKMMGWEKIVELVNMLLSEEEDYRIMLLGGPNESEKNEKIVSAIDSRRIIDAGCHNELLAFSAQVQRCDALVCGDTLALHVATALGVPSVACFGPTSPSEIYDYDGLIQKVFDGSLPCIGCYNGQCQMEKNCMDCISLSEIIKRIRKQLLLGDVSRKT